jgi:uncharacterized protein
MIRVIAYRTPQDYLNATEGFLMQKELESNLLLGLCYNLPDKSKAHPNCVFINVEEDGEILATSIKTWEKAVVGGLTKDSAHVVPLAAYYRDHQIPIKGVVGEDFYAKQFAALYGGGVGQTKTLLVHGLTAVNSLPLSSGEMEQASPADLNLLTEWALQFEEDTQSFPRKSLEEITKRTMAKIDRGDIFKWVDHGEPVSMGAVVRRTQNVGFIGMVFTPDGYRGKGYATSCVLKMSELILQQGYRYCGLFTDKANPTSNRIYARIGYIPTAEFTDIEFAMAK